MVALLSDETGLPMGVWVASGIRAGITGKARIKVHRRHGRRLDPTNTATVALEPLPHRIEGELAERDVVKVYQWAALNYDVLIDYWKGRIGIPDLLARLRRLR